MSERKVVVSWVLRELYGGDVKRASKATGYKVQQLTKWARGTRTPQTDTICKLMHHAFEPAFTIIAEFKPIAHDGTIQGVHKQLAAILKGFEKASGVYAFYDSSANLLYLGKSEGRLLEECYIQIKAKATKTAFPRGAPQPATRLQMVRYVSAYRVNDSEFEDYAKHVEALILRLRKPPLNVKSGKLKKAVPASS